MAKNNPVINLDSLTAKQIEALQLLADSMRKPKDTETEPENIALKVTKVQVFPFKESNVGHFKAIATIILNNQLIIRGLRILETDDGLVVKFPPDPFFKGEEQRYYVATSDESLMKEITDAVIEQYHHAID